MINLEAYRHYLLTNVPDSSLCKVADLLYESCLSDPSAICEISDKLDHSGFYNFDLNDFVAFIDALNIGYDTFTISNMEPDSQIMLEVRLSYEAMMCNIQGDYDANFGCFPLGLRIWQPGVFEHYRRVVTLFTRAIDNPIGIFNEVDNVFGTYLASVYRYLDFDNQEVDDQFAID